MVSKIKYEVIVVGISTGGPSTLREILSSIDSIKIPILIAQHMPKGFSEGLVKGLNHISKVPVVEAYDGMKLTNSIIMAKAGYHLLFNKYNPKEIKISEEPQTEHFFPSVDVLFNSAAEVYGNKAISLVMTGLSAYDDGVKGTEAVFKAGGLPLVQAATSCVAPGMPLNSIHKSNVKCIADIEEIKMLFKDYNIFYDFMKNKRPLNNKVNILIVEDHPSHQYMLKQILISEKYNVDTASDGLKAIEMATKKKYEIVLMDVRMPNMDGIAATEALYQIDPMQKVVFVTASISDDTRRKIKSLNVFDYLYKPIKLNNLLDIVDRAVKKYYLC
jgi:two-component system, chemotaxis family, protein-glutamate methylesterase/glutaminase